MAQEFDQLKIDLSTVTYFHEGKYCFQGDPEDKIGVIIGDNHMFPTFFGKLDNLESIRRFNYLKDVGRKEGMSGVTRVYQDHLYPWLKKLEAPPV